MRTYQNPWSCKLPKTTLTLAYLNFSLCVALFVYHLVITSEDKMFKRVYIILTLDFSINSNETRTIVDYQTGDLQSIYQFLNISRSV